MNAPVKPNDLKAGATRRDLVVGATLVGGALLVGCSPADILSLGAKTDFGALLSLIYLTPFALRATDNSLLSAGQADLYDKWNADKNLSAEGRAKGIPNFSDMYLQDRAAMLAWIVKRNSDDNTDTTMKGPVDQLFRDTATNISIRTGSGAIPVDDMDKRRFLFGGAIADPLLGGSKGDHLYGGDGNDTLDGKEGNDYLEGNADDDTLTGGTGNDILVGGNGTDTYLFKAGDGWDTIIDSDGLGSIAYDGTALNGGKKEPGIDLWKSADKKFTFTLFAEGDGRDRMKCGAR